MRYTDTNMDAFISIAEEKISQAMRNGEFDDLAGAGRPLPKDGLAAVPEELRMGYRMLKNAGVLPPEMELKKEIVTLQALIDACADPSERAALSSRLTEKRLRFDMLMEKRGGVAAEYAARFREKLG